MIDISITLFHQKEWAIRVLMSWKAVKLQIS
jgi:hypothetical protein